MVQKHCKHLDVLDDCVHCFSNRSQDFGLHLQGRKYLSKEIKSKQKFKLANCLLSQRKRAEEGLFINLFLGHGRKENYKLQS